MKGTIYFVAVLAVAGTFGKFKLHTVEHLELVQMNCTNVCSFLKKGSSNNYIFSLNTYWCCTKFTYVSLSRCFG